MNCEVCKNEIPADHNYLKYKIIKSEEDKVICIQCVSWITDQFMKACQHELQSREANGDNTEEPSHDAI